MPRASKPSEEREIVDIFAELQDEPSGSDPAVSVPAGSVAAAAGPAVPAPVAPAGMSHDARIAELEAQLADALAGHPAGAGAAGDAVVPPDGPVNDESIVIHFVENGFTAIGQVWYRGQEIEFPPGSRAYQDTCDRNGRSWLDLRLDEDAQIDKFGMVMFRDGPWRGKSYTAAAGAPLDFALKPLRDGDRPIAAPTQDELHAAAAAEARRRRYAPRMVVTDGH